MHGFLSFYEVMTTGNLAIDDSLAFLSSQWEEEERVMVGFQVIDREAPSGFSRVREEIEAHVAAAYLLSIQFTQLFHTFVEQADGFFQSEISNEAE